METEYTHQFKKHDCVHLLCCVDHLSARQIKMIYTETLEKVLEITDDLEYHHLENMRDYDIAEEHAYVTLERESIDYFKQHLKGFLCLNPPSNTMPEMEKKAGQITCPH